MNENHTAEDAAVAKLQKLVSIQCSESDAAEEVARKVLVDRYRFSPALGWLRWDGCRWDTDETGERSALEVIRLFVKETEERLRKEGFRQAALRLPPLAAVLERHPLPGDPPVKAEELELKEATAMIERYGTATEREEFAAAVASSAELLAQANMWKNMGSRAKLTALTALCSGMEHILTRAADLDAHPDMLNCTNGYVDLRTGELHDSDPKMLFSKVAGGAYVHDAKSDIWEKALEAVHPDCLEWYQVRMGQSITGYTPDDDSLVVSAGGGENGKTAVMLGITRGLGDYYTLVPHKALLSGPGEHTTELMYFRGARLALLEETPEEGRLDTHRVKTTIGTPQITARLMRQDNVTFNTSHSLWINTNFVPQVDTTDWGTWRRLKAMPWPYTFRKPGQAVEEESHREGDLTLKPSLQRAGGVPEAVLAWLVDGAIMWNASGQQMPEDPAAVVEATAKWRATSDVGLRFATEHLVADERGFITAETMRTQFAVFLEAEGKRPWSATLLNSRLPDSLTAAGIHVSADPSKTTKVRKDDEQSTRASDDVWKRTTATQELPPGKVVRMWRGVRFRTAKDDTDAGHLKAV